MAKKELNNIAMLAIAFFLITLSLTVHRHFTFFSTYDQGIFNQLFWNNLHRNWFESSLSSQLSTNVVHGGELPRVDYHRLGQHFTPALLLWLPIYAVFPYPITLTVIQVTLVTAAGIVLYVLARQYLLPPLATMISASFYGATAVIGPTLANFHDLSQIPLLIFTLLLAMEKRWWWLFWLVAIATLAVREDSGITLFGVGAYLVLSRRYPKVGLAVCAIAGLYILALTNLIMPLFSEDIAKRFMLERFGQYVEGDRASTLDIIWGMVSNPTIVLQELFTPIGKTIQYFLGHWLPLAFIPALSGAAWIISGFPLLKLLLGQGDTVLVVNVRYSMSVVPGLFYGTILWWGTKKQSQPQSVFNSILPKRLRPKFKQFWLGCITLSILFAYTSSTTELSRAFYFALPDSINPWVYVSLPQQWQHSAKIYQLLTKIPPQASVAATTEIIPHLSGRRAIVRLPLLQLRDDTGEAVGVDWAIADLKRLQQYGVAFTPDKNRLMAIAATIDQQIKSEYGVVDWRDGVILLGRNQASQPQALVKYQNWRRQL